jgi:hypothetical protein
MKSAMPTLLKVALICGATPLIVGFAIYISWRLNRAEWLMGAGLANIAAGLLMFLVGVVCLSMRSTKLPIGAPDVHRRRSKLRKLAWVLLTANFPAALLMALSAIDVETRYTVTVINETSAPIQSFLLSGPGVRVEMGPISPNGKAKKHLCFSGNGSLEFVARLAESKTNGVIEDYVSLGLSGRNIVRVKADGSIKVEQASR